MSDPHPGTRAQHRSQERTENTCKRRKGGNSEEGRAEILFNQKQGLVALPGIALLPTPITTKRVSDYGLAVKGNAIQVF